MDKKEQTLVLLRTKTTEAMEGITEQSEHPLFGKYIKPVTAFLKTFTVILFAHLGQAGSEINELRERIEKLEKQGAQNG